MEERKSSGFVLRSALDASLSSCFVVLTFLLPLPVLSSRKPSTGEMIEASSLYIFTTNGPKTSPSEDGFGNSCSNRWTNTSTDWRLLSERESI